MRLVAHRGYPARYPENSLAGIAAAIQCGARFVEVDVQLTRDGVPLLLHDVDLRRHCGVDVNVLGVTYGDLAALACGGPAKEPPARLAELADLATRHPHIRLFVELKPESLLHHGREPVLEATRSALDACAAQVVLISFDLAVLECARAAIDLPVGAVHHRWDFHAAGPFNRLSPEYFFCNRLYLPETGDLALGDTTLAVYETVDPREAVRLLERGVDLVETFDLCAMAQALAGTAFA